MGHLILNYFLFLILVFYIFDKDLLKIFHYLKNKKLLYQKKKYKNKLFFNEKYCFKIIISLLLLNL